jgi:acetolactate decarboxylase
MRNFSFVLFLLVSLAFACNETTIEENEIESSDPVLIQVSVIDALLQGIYDGTYPINELPNLGDVGIGTFDALDGEMIMLNDTVFQVVSTGEVKIPESDMLTPFAAVSGWQTDTSFTIKKGTFESLKSNFDSYFPTRNIFYAVKINGLFSHVKTRSVPRQEKPYRPLAEVTAKQPEFEFNNIRGTIVGFYCPPYATGINVTGLHLHFLSSDRKGGGHLLECQLEEGTLELCYLFDFKLILPEGGDFYGGDFTVDRTDDLEKAEN